MNKKGIILLSGGLDSLVALDIASKQMKIEMALFFDYGQKAYNDELQAALKIAQKYSIKLENIELPFLKSITNNALTNADNSDYQNLKSVWIPNRNGLFLNIAACYCDSLSIDYIIYGANKEEGRDFSDNNKDYITVANANFKYSTLQHPQVFAPCVDMTKVDLVNYMIDNDLSFKLIKSCYKNTLETGKKHCLECMSCKMLYNAIMSGKNPQVLEEIF